MKHCLATLALMAITLGPAIGCARPDYATAEGSVAADSVATLTFAQSGLQAAITFANTPTSQAENKFEIKFFDASAGATADQGPFVDPANSLTVLLWMPAMGHGSSPVTITKTATGVYDISRAYFIMPGAWQIRLQLKDASGAVVEESDFDLQVQ